MTSCEQFPQPLEPSQEYLDKLNEYQATLTAVFAEHGFNEIVLAELKANGQTPGFTYGDHFMTRAAVQLPKQLQVFCLRASGLQKAAETGRGIRPRVIVLTPQSAEIYFDINTGSSNHGVSPPAYLLSFDLIKGILIPYRDRLVYANTTTDQILTPEILHNLAEIPAIISPLPATCPIALKTIK